MTWFPRLIGVATAAYSVAVLAKPTVLTEPCKLTDAAGRTSQAAGQLARAVASRDLVSAVAVALAPAGTPLKVALAVRIGADVGDAVLLGSAAPDKTTRLKIIGVAAGWAALTALSVLAAGT